MSSSVSNPSSPSRPSNSPSTRRASTSPRSLSSSYTSSSHAQVEYPFGSAATIQIDRTVSVTIEILSSSAPASHMDASQYHMPVTTSCYSPTTSTTYGYAKTASEHETSTSYTSQGAYPFTPSTTEGSLLSHHGQSLANGKQGSLGYPYGSEEYHLSSGSLYQQQKDVHSEHSFSKIGPSQITMLDRFLTVDSREDALVIEARAAIQDGRVRDGNTLASGLYGWESAINSL